MPQTPRKNNRIDRNTAAALVSLTGTEIIDCVLKNTSAAGARISVEVPEVVPDYFFVRVQKQGEQSFRKCRVRWRVGNDLGVEFFSDSETSRLHS